MNLTPFLIHLSSWQQAVPSPAPQLASARETVPRRLLGLSEHSNRQLERNYVLYILRTEARDFSAPD